MTPKIDPVFIPVLSDLGKGLRELGVPFCVIGALVPQLLLEHRPDRLTNDADITVAVDGLAEFEHLKHRLAQFGFAPTRLAYRLQHRDGGLVDMLPFSDGVAPGGTLELEPGLVLNMVGFRYVIPSAIVVAITDELTVPVAPVPLYVLLKLLAFADRKAPKDLGSVFHCLQHHMEDDDQRYGLDHAGEGVPFEYTCAYLTGSACRQFLDTPVSEAVRRVLDQFVDEDAAVVGTVVREMGRSFAEPSYRTEVLAHFLWFRRATGL